MCVKFLTQIQSNNRVGSYAAAKTTLPARAVLSLEVMRVTFHCQQYIFVVNNEYIFILRNIFRCKQSYQSHSICCDTPVFTLGAR